MRRSRSRPAGLATIALAISLSACGVSSTSSPSPFDEPPAPLLPSPDDTPVEGAPDEIGREEILERGSNDLTAMALIRRLRPGWLRARGRNSFTNESAMYPVVYIDEIRHGALSTLNQIPAAEILSMRFYNTADATTRWGTGHPSGVINVETGR